MKELKDKLSKYFKENNNVKFAYLFGSYYDNTYKQNSDIDIALYLEKYSLDLQLQMTYELSKILKKDIDLLILNNVRNVYLLDNILNNSTVLKDDEFRLDYELKKEHEILDFKAFRKIIDAA